MTGTSGSTPTAPRRRGHREEPSDGGGARPRAGRGPRGPERLRASRASRGLASTSTRCARTRGCPQPTRPIAERPRSQAAVSSEPPHTGSICTCRIPARKTSGSGCSSRVSASTIAVFARHPLSFEGSVDEPVERGDQFRSQGRRSELARELRGPRDDDRDAIGETLSKNRERGLRSRRLTSVVQPRSLLLDGSFRGDTGRPQAVAGGTSSSGMGRAVNTRRQGFAINRAHCRARFRALSVARPVLAYIWGKSFEIST